MDVESGLLEVEDRVNSKLKVLIPDIYRILNAFEISKEDTLNRHAYMSVHIKQLQDRVKKIDNSNCGFESRLKHHEELLTLLANQIDALAEPW